jgi:hypothetical protein
MSQFPAFPGSTVRRRPAGVGQYPMSPATFDQYQPPVPQPMTPAMPMPQQPQGAGGMMPSGAPQSYQDQMHERIHQGAVMNNALKARQMAGMVAGPGSETRSQGYNERADMLAGMLPNYGNTYFQGRDLATSANQRADTANTALSGNYDANSYLQRTQGNSLSQMTPALAAQAMSGANLNNANAGRITEMTPAMVGATNEGTRGQHIQNDIAGSYGGQQAAANVAATTANAGVNPGLLKQYQDQLKLHQQRIAQLEGRLAQYQNNNNAGFDGSGGGQPATPPAATPTPTPSPEPQPTPPAGASLAQNSAGGNVPRPQSEAEMLALPPGTVFQAPDGSMRRR